MTAPCVAQRAGPFSLPKDKLSPVAGVVSFARTDSGAVLVAGFR